MGGTGVPSAARVVLALCSLWMFDKGAVDVVRQREDIFFHLQQNALGSPVYMRLSYNGRCFPPK